MTTEKYTGSAAGWSRNAYADVESYLGHRAALIVSLGRPLAPGDSVVDLACGDGGLADFLLSHGLVYTGVDLNEAMVAEARRQLEGRARVELADLNDYVPDSPVAATTLFRSLYYARGRTAFFRHVLGYTERKLVFDLNPRQYPLDEVVAELRAAGFARVVTRPFLVPQRLALPKPLAALARLAERSGPLARLALRYRFTYLVAALR